jgi:hypothetical protein
VAVAYATWGGLSLIAKDLEKFLARGRLLETIYGTENGVTTADALLYSIHLQRQFPGYSTALSCKWKFVDSEFHPKYWEFEYQTHTVCIVGSPNCTRGGLAGNHELSVFIDAATNTGFLRDVRSLWSGYSRRAEPITPSLMRNSRAMLGSETRPFGSKGVYQALRISLPAAPKPLFSYLIDQKGSAERRHRTLADADRLSQKPGRLYLQILRRETGGGHQIQLPVATLAAFFGVGPGEVRPARFEFRETGEIAEVDLTHFPNHTHRIRLRPLKEVKRPAVIIIRRLPEPDRFDVQVVSRAEYGLVLKTKCTEQTRNGSRFWGLES